MALCFAVLGQTTYTVVQVQEYSRHGVRTAKTYFPNPLNDTEKNLGINTLTPNGYRQQYMIGQEVRKRYPSVFDTQFSFRNVEVFSSPEVRTQVSVWSQLTSILPFGSGSNITGRLEDSLPQFDSIVQKMDGTYALPEGFSAFPIKVESWELDFLFFPSEGVSSCPKAAAWFKTFKNAQYKKYDSFVTDTASKLEALGYNSSTTFKVQKWDLSSLGSFYSELQAKWNYYGKQTETNISEELIEKLKLMQSLKFAVEFNDPTVRKMRNSGIARSIIKAMDTFINGTASDKIRFRLFGGHDTGLQPHGMSLGTTSVDCIVDKIQGNKNTNMCEPAPPFSSAFFYELAVDSSNKYHARILYNGKKVPICSATEESPSSDGYCPYETFKKIYEEKMYMDVNDFDEYCGNKMIQNKRSIEEKRSSQRIFTSSNRNVWIVYFLLVATTVVVIAWRCFVIRSKIRKEVEQYNKIHGTGAADSSIEHETLKAEEKQ